jgi:hypothetical protein
VQQRAGGGVEQRHGAVHGARRQAAAVGRGGHGEDEALAAAGVLGLRGEGKK